MGALGTMKDSKDATWLSSLEYLISSAISPMPYLELSTEPSGLPSWSSTHAIDRDYPRSPQNQTGHCAGNPLNLESSVKVQPTRQTNTESPNLYLGHTSLAVKVIVSCGLPAEVHPLVFYYRGFSPEFTFKHPPSAVHCLLVL